MKRTPPAASPDAYVQALTGWRRERVEMLRAAALAAGPELELIKWGHIVMLANGPALLIRAEEDRILYGFWRGKRLLHLDPRLTGTSKYEMASLELREDTLLDPEIAAALAREAVALNRQLGDPTARS